MRHYLEYFLFLLVATLFRCLPLKMGLKIGRGIGGFSCLLDREHRQIAWQNIRSAALGLNNQQASEVVKKVYRNLGVSLAEFFYMSRVDQRYIEQFVSIEGKENLDAALFAGKGVIMIFGHFGSWELNNALYGVLGYPVTAVAFKQNNKMTDKIINRYRQCQGVKVVYDGAPYQDLAAILKAGRILALVADQDAGRHGIMVDFLGRPASTAKGPAVLALRTGAPLMVSLLIRQDNNRHRLILKGPLPVIRTGNFKRDVLSNTRQWSEILEDWVKAYPDQWFWLHRRWKTQKKGSGVGGGITPDPLINGGYYNEKD